MTTRSSAAHLLSATVVRSLRGRTLHLLFGAALFLIIALPIAQPFTQLRDPAVWSWNADDLVRVSRLGANTLLLVFGTCLIAVPAGTLLAVLLTRTDLPFRRPCLLLLVVVLFVPLPVIVSSWQSFLGAGGLLPFAWWVNSEGRPWVAGWGPAIWVHAVAAIPWVAAIVGLALRWVEPELQEEAALQVPAWRVVLWVTLPRCRVSILAAALFVGLNTASEISVTDMMLVSTLAEEVYTQFTLGEEGLGRTLLLALPGLLLAIGLLSIATVWMERALPPLPVWLRTSVRWPLKPAWPWMAFVGVIFAILVLPSAGLVWKLGESGPMRTWSVLHAWHQLTGEARVLGIALLSSLVKAMATGAVVTVVALVACWLALESRLLRAFLLLLLATAWIVPGPVVGIGLKALILEMVVEPPDGWLGELVRLYNRAIYYGPSAVPLVWAQVIRFLPAAVFFLWPVMRLIPRELMEAAHLEGAGTVRRFLQIGWPSTRSACGVILLAMTALALGEHEASGRVTTPGGASFARLLFDRMHYGSDSTVAALSLLLLLLVAVCGGLLTLAIVFLRRRR